VFETSERHNFGIIYVFSDKASNRKVRACSNWDLYALFARWKRMWGGHIRLPVC